MSGSRGGSLNQLSTWFVSHDGGVAQLTWSVVLFNPVGVGRYFDGWTQGNSCLATLGLGMESLWDS
jgi:hypothetical protein